MIEDTLCPEDDELAMGEEAVCDLVAHLKRMRAIATSFENLDGGTLWKVTVEAKTAGMVN
jgi:hypothetical protein